jgi:hypothetical protein
VHMGHALVAPDALEYRSDRAGIVHPLLQKVPSGSSLEERSGKVCVNDEDYWTCRGAL